MSASDSIVDPGTVLAERYRLTEEIGRGGFGMVYRARQLNMDRDVAIKILPPKFNAVADVVERFKREARLASRLRHPNTITVHDYGSHDDLLFIVMEILEGEDLADILAETPVLGLERILHIGRQVLKSLNEAHGHNIIHRDLKPENIFLTRVGGEEDFVKVLDFGVAKLAMPQDGQDAQGRKLTVTGSTVGTPTYMSPEQAAGEEVDPLTDLYALAVILYEMACGRPPFQGDNPVKIMRSHLFEPVPAFAQHPLRGSKFEAVLFKALAKEKPDRWASAQQFMNALEGSVAEMLEPAGEINDPPTAEFFGLDLSSEEITREDMPGGEVDEDWVEPRRPSSMPDFRPRTSDLLDSRDKRTTESLLASLEADWPAPSVDENPLAQPQDDAPFDHIPFESLPASPQDRVHEGAAGTSSSLSQTSALSDAGGRGTPDFAQTGPAPAPSSTSGSWRDSQAPTGFRDSGTTTSSIITIREPQPDEIILLTQKKEPTPTPQQAQPRLSEPASGQRVATESSEQPAAARQPGNTGQPAAEQLANPGELDLQNSAAGPADQSAPSPGPSGDANWSWGEHSPMIRAPQDGQLGLSGADLAGNPTNKRNNSLSATLIILALLVLAGIAWFTYF